MSDRRIDLRSDTVTRPDDEMRRAMAAAEVGDDVFEEDPTVRRLEQEAAAAMGKAAALFMPTGTMGNQVALHLHAARGAEVVCEAKCHVVNYEMGAMAALSGLLPRLVDGGPCGRLEAAAVEAAIRPAVSYLARTGAIAVENTHNMAGGTVSTAERSAALVAVARRHALPIHLDGARLWNAATALGVAPAALAEGFDSVMFSLSKGLGAPVGSMLCGGADFIREARRVRKMFGGAMRQVGVLAAAGRVALARGPENLAADHANARWLAEELAALPGVELDPATVETNIVIFRVTAEGGAAGFVARAAEGGVLAVPISHQQVRLVTHRDVARGSVERAAEVFRQMLAG